MKVIKCCSVLMIFLFLHGCSNVFQTYMSIPYASLDNVVKGDHPKDLREIEDILQYQDLVIWPMLENSREVFGGQYLLGVQVEEFENGSSYQVQPFIFVLGFKATGNNIKITPYATELNFRDSKFNPEEASLIESGESCLKGVKDNERILKLVEYVEVSKSHNNFGLDDSSWKCLRFKLDVK